MTRRQLKGHQGGYSTRISNADDTGVLRVKDAWVWKTRRFLDLVNGLSHDETTEDEKPDWKVLESVV
jgi:hypothetical protein